MADSVLMCLLTILLCVGNPATTLSSGFEFYPAQTPDKQAYWDKKLNTWGGSVYNDSGTYHMFMSAMADGKPLSSWSTASCVIVYDI